MGFFFYGIRNCVAQLFTEETQRHINMVAHHLRLRLQYHRLAIDGNLAAVWINNNELAFCRDRSTARRAIPLNRYANAFKKIPKSQGAAATFQKDRLGSVNQRGIVKDTDIVNQVFIIPS